VSRSAALSAALGRSPTRGLRAIRVTSLRLGVGRHPRSQTRPSGLGSALLARASSGLGFARSRTRLAHSGLNPDAVTIGPHFA